MHISEGIMTAPVLGAGWVATAGLLALSLRKVNKIKDSLLPKMAVFASAFFLASLVRVPIGATSAHFALLGLMGLTLGWGSFPAIFMALILQALLFQFGGLASLGVNACIMGIPALLAYALFSKAVTAPAAPLDAASTTAKGKGFWAGMGRAGVAAFLAGVLPIALGTGLIFAALFASHAALASTAGLLAVANAPLAFMEGLVVLFAVGFLRKVAPDMLAAPTVTAEEAAHVSA